MSILTFVLTLVLHPRALHAQEDFRFQPPRPPPLDVDFDDEDEEEMGDDFSRIPTAPAVVNPGGNNRVEPPPPPPTGGSDFGSSSVSAGKFRFRLVDGDYWEKGKKRARGKETHVTSGEDSRAGGR